MKQAITTLTPDLDLTFLAGAYHGEMGWTWRIPFWSSVPPGEVIELAIHRRLPIASHCRFCTAEHIVSFKIRLSDMDRKKVINLQVVANSTEVWCIDQSCGANVNISPVRVGICLVGDVSVARLSLFMADKVSTLCLTMFLRTYPVRDRLAGINLCFPIITIIPRRRRCNVKRREKARKFLS